MGSQRLKWDETPPPSFRQGALTIGNFDGVHRGHRALLAELRRQANTIGGPVVVLTFDPHPLQLLRPERFQPLLTTVEDRADLLQSAGADHVAIMETSRELLQLPPEEFFARVIQDSFQARAVVEGGNFGFGRNREGTVETLKALCNKATVSLTVVQAVEQNGQRISSSRVRDALVRGDVRAAAGLLDRPYRLRGTVGVGRKRGQTLGFPTANLEGIVTLVPGDGVYAVRVFAPLSPGGRGAGGEGAGLQGVWPGAANIGPNPTFGEQARKVEVHLIGFQGDLYGQPLAVDFIDRLRDTRPFAGPAELVEQLRRDVEEARHRVAAAGQL
jgi:riboflavin kinase/FMN adenylyltransferase